jgi:hypothetical protein
MSQSILAVSNESAFNFYLLQFLFLNFYLGGSAAAIIAAYNRRLEIGGCEDYQAKNRGGGGQFRLDIRPHRNR